MFKKLSVLLASLCLLLSGCSAKNDTSATENSGRDVTVDFVVVGGGAGGLSAASEAARQGKKRNLVRKISANRRIQCIM